MKKIYDPTPFTNNGELINVAKSSIEEICTKLPLRIQCIRIAIIQFKKDSENEAVEKPIEIEVSR